VSAMGGSKGEGGGAGGAASAASAMIAENPFFVLGVAPDASRLEIEREGQKLLGMIELGFADALTYATPLGPRGRDGEAVRAALAALRDPARRLVAELWARHAPPHAAAAPAPSAAASAAPAHPGLPQARARLGWGG
jgi:hypothetical protein